MEIKTGIGTFCTKFQFSFSILKFEINLISKILTGIGMFSVTGQWQSEFLQSPLHPLSSSLSESQHDFFSVDLSLQHDFSVLKFFEILPHENRLLVGIMSKRKVNM